MRSGCHRAGPAALGLALAVTLAGVARAQAQGPLSKSDLIRVLAGNVLSADEMDDLVRRRCTSFTPSERDRADLRAAGAGDAIIRAIDTCRRAAETLRVRVPSPDLVIEAGDEARVRAELRRGGDPAAGVPLMLIGSGRITGEGRDVEAVTDVSGVATFVFPVGRQLATHTLTVAPRSGNPLGGNPAVTLRVGPAGRLRAELAPPRVEWQHGQDSQAVTVVLRDALGNRVPGQRVELVRGGVAVLPSRQSDATGTVQFTLAASAFADGARLIVRAGRRVVDSLDVVAPAPVSAARTGFVSGHGQQGRVGLPLPQVLVFEVRDSANVGLPDRTVAIAAENAVAEADADRTDANGRVRIQVRLGERAGPATVTARVAGIERRAALLALPGPAVALRVTCGSGLHGRVLLRPDTTGVLVITASDAYGNPVPLREGVRAVTGDRSIAQVVAVSADSTQARVTLRGRAAGSTNLAVTAAGVRSNLVTVVQAGAVAGVCAEVP